MVILLFVEILLVIPHRTYPYRGQLYNDDRSTVGLSFEATSNQMVLYRLLINHS